MNRAWIAPLGTDPDGPGWTALGHVLDHGLVVIDDLPRTGPPIRWPATVIITRDRRTGLTRVFSDDGTARSRRRLIKESARFDQDGLAIRWPAATQVKREHHRRRR
ncbi:hypothetical protein [Nonomuraea sp. 10N515B]|uniref:hypothetical protein n=1 Tax=Nonomuraea sp. 10N515B TaxID=3457422 RepID=UPI003FCC3EB7